MMATSPSDPLPDVDAFHLTVYGTPVPGGSKRALPLGGKFGGRPIVVDANAKARPWKENIKREAGAVMAGKALMRGPLQAHFVFYVRRPKSHFNAKGVLRPGVAQTPAKRPDLLKYARLVEDSLSRLVYADDAQIVTELLVKRYGEPERVEIHISPHDRIP